MDTWQDEGPSADAHGSIAQACMGRTHRDRTCWCNHVLNLQRIPPYPSRIPDEDALRAIPLSQCDLHRQASAGRYSAKLC